MISILQQKYSRSDNFFSASHILPGFSKCERLHGHDYVVKVTIDYCLLDSEHLIDFREVNTIIHSIIAKLDHKILLPGSSRKMQIQSTLRDKNWLVKIEDKEYSFPQQDVVILKDINQTTTENLTIYFHEQMTHQMKELISKCSEFRLKVTIAETTGNEVSYSDKL